MRVLHLTASTFYGGPERQMLGLADHLPPEVRTMFVSFAEGGRNAAFLDVVRGRGYPAVGLNRDFPHVLPAVRELAALIRDEAADVVLCHGYKPNILGRLAARRAGVPAVAVSRGWTGESRKVRFYETLDRINLRLMDHVVAVSAGQAAKVLKAGVPGGRVTVIRNAARPEAFAAPDPTARRELLAHFPGDAGVSRVVVAAGRLSPEKGFAVLAAAAGVFLREHPSAGVVLFGDGPERATIEAAAADFAGRFVLPGFTDRLDRLLPAADVAVLPSFTEGLPNVALEASAAGVPVVATAVGGTPEVIDDGVTGRLVLAGDPDSLASAVGELLADADLRRRFGDAGRRRMKAEFTFAAQARDYLTLFDRLRKEPPCRTTTRRRSASLSSSTT